MYMLIWNWAVLIFIIIILQQPHFSTLLNSFVIVKCLNMNGNIVYTRTAICGVGVRVGVLDQTSN